MQFPLGFVFVISLSVMFFRDGYISMLPPIWGGDCPWGEHIPSLGTL